ncbi:MAG: hypothetical protein NW206_19910 [Hyphomonadaceae bacterium]|nr:hypothetical protein [Hyphomonadaceae bacterium]
MQRDLLNDLKIAALAAIASTTDKTLAVDRKGYGTLAFLANIGIEGITLSGTDKIALLLEHADDNGSGAAGTYAAVAAADVVIPEQFASHASIDATVASGVVATFDANAELPAVLGFSYAGSKQWVRLTVDYSGTHGVATPVSAVAMLGTPQFAPVT